jgi:hypothetical protein
LVRKYKDLLIERRQHVCPQADNIEEEAFNVSDKEPIFDSEYFNNENTDNSYVKIKSESCSGLRPSHIFFESIEKENMNYCKILSNLNSCKLIFKGSFHG